MKPSLEDNITFISGVGRSGTSLLQSMLNVHTKITSIPETQCFRNYVLKNKIEHLGKESIKELIARDQRIGRSTVDTAEILEGVDSSRAFYISMLNKYLEIKNKEIIIDKDPGFIDFLPQLKENFPKGRILHIIRDPRDVVLSRTKADWSKHWPFFMHAVMYNTQMEYGYANGKGLFKERYFEVHYEDLLAHPKQVLSQTCEFLGYHYEENMLQFNKTSSELVDQSEMQWKSETLQPLISTNKEKWKKDLSKKQIYLIERVCSQIFKKYPYHISIPTPPLGLKIYVLPFILLSKLFRFFYPIRLYLLKR
jgi:hypothetical protein